MQGRIGRRVAAGVTGAVMICGIAIVAGGSPAAASKPVARAELRNAAGETIGSAVFEGKGNHAESVTIELALPAGAPGPNAFHGLHVHTIGDCTAPFTSAGGHWNLVSGATHGSHTGDLPSVLVGSDGTASATFVTQRFDVTQLFDANGSALVLHAGVDNFGNVPIEAAKYADPNNWYGSPTGTGNTGDAGSRYGCGVIQPA